jgi:hypothetical protein
MSIEQEIIQVLNQIPAAIEKALTEVWVQRHPGHGSQKVHGNRYGAGQAKESLRRLKDDKGAREQYKARARQKLGKESKPVRTPGKMGPKMVKVQGQGSLSGRTFEVSAELAENIATIPISNEVSFGKDATYSGRKRFQAKRPGVGTGGGSPGWQSDIALDIEQETSGGKTWSIINSYYEGGRGLSTKTALANGFSRADAKKIAQGILSNVEYADAGGKIVFDKKKAREDVERMMGRKIA